jgi:hypothetical protein
MCHDLRNRQVRRLARRRFQVCEIRNIFRDRVRNVQLALILQHQERDTRHRFCHRSDPKQSIRRHRPFLFKVRKPRRIQPHDLVFRNHNGYCARDLLFGDHLLHRPANRFVVEFRAVNSRSHRDCDQYSQWIHHPRLKPCARGSSKEKTGQSFPRPAGCY